MSNVNYQIKPDYLGLFFGDLQKYFLRCGYIYM